MCLVYKIFCLRLELWKSVHIILTKSYELKISGSGSIKSYDLKISGSGSIKSRILTQPNDSVHYNQCAQMLPVCLHLFFKSLCVSLQTSECVRLILYKCLYSNIYIIPYRHPSVYQWVLSNSPMFLHQDPSVSNSFSLYDSPVCLPLHPSVSTAIAQCV